MQWHIAPLSSPSPEGLFILILSDVSKLLMEIINFILLHMTEKDIPHDGWITVSITIHFI